MNPALAGIVQQSQSPFLGQLEELTSLIIGRPDATDQYELIMMFLKFGPQVVRDALLKEGSSLVDKNETSKYVFNTPAYREARLLYQAELDQSRGRVTEGLTECQKCHQETARFHRVQDRSSDEGSSVKYNCENCGHRWKE